MATLTAGVQYELSSQRFQENNDLIFVKLTDSAYRAIEEYLKNKNTITSKPTIEFVGNQGHLTFPSKNPGQGNFNFTISDNQSNEGPQGGFECVQQTGQRKLENLGALPCKMQIKANDDVYETTRSRMQQVEVDNKNKCTRVLKANDSVGKKVRIKKGEQRSTPASIASSSSQNSIRQHKAPSSSSLSALKQLKASAQMKASPKKNEKDKVLSESKSVSSRPIKERLVHLLALKAFTKPELCDRLSREGLKDKENNIIPMILKHVAYLKDEKYYLLENLYKDVQENWAYYSEEEKTLLKSGRVQTPKSNHSESPPSSTTGIAPQLNSSKRQGNDQASNGNPAKKQRTSRHAEPTPTVYTHYETNGYSSNNFVNGNAKSNHQQLSPWNPPKEELNSKAYTSDNQENSSDNDSSASSNVNVNNSPDIQELSFNGFSNNSQNTPCYVPYEQIPLESDDSEYLKNYTKIKNMDQRAQYKLDFYNYFPIYNRMHQHLTQIAHQFKVLETKLQNEKQNGNTVGCEELSKLICAEYERKVGVKQEFYKLHSKLEHIKQLVAEYDAKMGI